VSRYGSFIQTPFSRLPFGCRLTIGYGSRHPQRPLDTPTSPMDFKLLFSLIIKQIIANLRLNVYCIRWNQNINVRFSKTFYPLRVPKSKSATMLDEDGQP
jgi:hypothetical protein